MDRFGRVKINAWTKDLTTDVSFYDVRLAYDRNSNITSIDDQVQSGFDYGLTNDALNRLTTAEQGTWTGSAITSRTRNESWTLTQTGNWKDYYRDVTGDNNYTDAGEFRAIGLFNDVNEQTQRGLDTTGDGTPDTTQTLTYDKVGNMTDDGESRTLVYDAFGRLRFVKTRGGSPAVVSEHRYNGLGYRIGQHSDVTDDGTTGDPDGVVNSDDPWYYFTYDDRWRIVASFRGSDNNAKERFFHHNAGLSGEGGGSYIDALILRDRDANTVWYEAADSTTEERVYYCQNWRADVVNLLKDAGSGAVEQIEAVRYTAYGVPFGLPKGDVNSDGVCDFSDYLEAIGWGSHDARGDIDLDGDVDSNDLAAISGASGASLGLGQLSLEPDASSARVGNRVGYAGYVHEAASGLDHVRHRALDAERGRWIRRDPMGHVDGVGLYTYAKSSPFLSTDPLGLFSDTCGGGTCGAYPGAPYIPSYPSPNEVYAGTMTMDSLTEAIKQCLKHKDKCKRFECIFDAVETFNGLSGGKLQDMLDRFRDLKTLWCLKGDPSKIDDAWCTLQYNIIKPMCDSCGNCRSAGGSPTEEDCAKYGKTVLCYSACIGLYQHFDAVCAKGPGGKPDPDRHKTKIEGFKNANKKCDKALRRCVQHGW